MKNYLYWLNKEEFALYQYLLKEKVTTLDEFVAKTGKNRHEAMQAFNQLRKKGLIKLKYNPEIIILNG